MPAARVLFQPAGRTPLIVGICVALVAWSEGSLPTGSASPSHTTSSPTSLSASHGSVGSRAEGKVNEQSSFGFGFTGPYKLSGSSVGSGVREETAARLCSRLQCLADLASVGDSGAGRPRALGGAAAALPALQPRLLPPPLARLPRWPQLPSELSALLRGSLRQSKPLPQSRPRRARTAARLLQPRCRKGSGLRSRVMGKGGGKGKRSRGPRRSRRYTSLLGDPCLSPSLRSCPMLRWIASTG